MEQPTALAGTVRSAQLVDVPAVVRVLVGEHPAGVTPDQAEAVERVTRLMLAHFGLASESVWIHDHPRDGVGAVAVAMSREDRPDADAARRLLAREAPWHLDLLGVEQIGEGAGALAQLPDEPETLLVLARAEPADAAGARGADDTDGTDGTNEAADDAAARAVAAAALASLGDADRPVGAVSRSRHDLRVFASLGFGAGRRHLLPSGAGLWFCRRDGRPAP
ncbi:MAG: hypothetical protein HOW97_37525 [Catenulispora sp.]|nr:hypothetical protein [Catenulispora sp.]